MGDVPKNTPGKIRFLRGLPHESYLESTWWRVRRQARVQQAGGKCERCHAVVKFVDVHHVHYDRKGEERDSDLEVLCRDCHGKTHFEESRKQHIGQYLMIARETLRHDQPESFTDFKDAFRARLRKFDLPIDHRFDDAMTIVWDKKPVAIATPARRQSLAAAGPDLPPMGHHEAVELCRRMGLKMPFQSMPERYGVGTGVAAIRARAANRLKGAWCPACRRTGHAQLSGAQPGWLFCMACQHKWEIPLDILGRKSG